MDEHPEIASPVILDCFVILGALQAAGIPATCPALTPWSADNSEWIAVVSLFDEAFQDEAAVRAAFETLGLRVEWIQHDLYSRFNHTAGGVDEGGGKTWNVIFALASAPVMEDATESRAEHG